VLASGSGSLPPSSSPQPTKAVLLKATTHATNHKCFAIVLILP
jgi:hypothetical protein